MGDNPKISVIIATFNWSSALRLALESVLDQTFPDFEVLVVGDACTDDSEDVVRSFGDDRLHWHNLPENYGIQSGPNNQGLSMARGEYVAYLGHDDLWWPTHLQTALETFERTGADMVSSATLLYAPPESGVRSVTGFFPNDTYSARLFFPPSSMLHRLELAKRIGGWRSPDEAMVAVDYDFLFRCHMAGARIASTGEFTTFKFNAAWRRDVYRLRDPYEQRRFLSLMRSDGDAFRMRELTDTLRSAVEDRLHKLELSPGHNIKAAQSNEINQVFKGTRRVRTPAKAILVDGRRRRYAPDNAYSGFEWHEPEHHPVLGSFRWSGPSRRSSIVLPEKIDGPTEIRLLLINWITEEVVSSVRLSVNGTSIETRLISGPQSTRVLVGQIPPGPLHAQDDEEIRLVIDIDKTHRPIDLGINEDRRWLGLAVGWVEVEPIKNA